MWNYLQQLRRVARSPLIVCMTMVFSNLLGTCIVRIKCARMYFAQKDFSISRQKRLSFSSMHVHVSGAQNSFWRTNNFVFLGVSSRDIYFWRDAKSIQDVIRDVYCLACPNEKCVHLSTNKTSNFYDCEKCEACSHVVNVPLKDQKPEIMLFGGDGTHSFSR